MMNARTMPTTTCVRWSHPARIIRVCHRPKLLLPLKELCGHQTNLVVKLRACLFFSWVCPKVLWPDLVGLYLPVEHIPHCVGDDENEKEQKQQHKKHGRLMKNHSTRSLLMSWPCVERWAHTDTKCTRWQHQLTELLPVQEKLALCL